MIKDILLNIAGHKLRASLTILGVIMAITLFILLRGLMYRISTESSEFFENLGNADIITLQSKPPSKFTERPKFMPLSLRDYDALRSLSVTVRSSPNVELFWLKGVSAEAEFYGKANGVSSQYFEMYNLPLTMGRYFTKEEVDQNACVVILGKLVAEGLFKKTNPIGKEIHIFGRSFKVIGVCKSEYESVVKQSTKFVPIRDGGGHSLMLSWRGIIMPYTTANVLYDADKYILPDAYGRPLAFQLRPRDTLQEIFIETTQNGRVMIRNLIRQLHQADDVILSTVDNLFLGKDHHIQNTTIAVYIISSLSVIIGTIGVFSVMLTSVNQQLREIGIKKALGATPSILFTQFILESIILSLIGGLCGILLSSLLSDVILNLTNFRPIITYSTMLMGLCLSILLGFLAGILPAWRAAQLQPSQLLQ